jgi:hypothetical protein
MDFFTPIPDAKALLCTNGAYAEAPLFHMSQEIYAKKGSSYIKLRSDRGTTSRATHWKTLHIPEGVIGTQQHRFVWLAKAAPKALIPVNTDPNF